MNSSTRDYLLVSLSTISAIALCTIAVSVGIRPNPEGPKEVQFWLLMQREYVIEKIPFYTLIDCKYAIKKIAEEESWWMERRRFSNKTYSACIQAKSPSNYTGD